MSIRRSLTRWEPYDKTWRMPKSWIWSSSRRSRSSKAIRVSLTLYRTLARGSRLSSCSLSKTVTKRTSRSKKYNLNWEMLKTGSEASNKRKLSILPKSKSWVEKPVNSRKSWLFRRQRERTTCDPTPPRPTCARALPTYCRRTSSSRSRHKTNSLPKSRNSRIWNVITPLSTPRTSSSKTDSTSLSIALASCRKEIQRWSSATLLESPKGVRCAAQRHLKPRWRVNWWSKWKNRRRIWALLT